jgi:Zn-dependent M28 family amino/carboxypeptidase
MTAATMSEPSSAAPLPRAEPDVLARHVRALEGERHPDASPAALGRALAYVADILDSRGWAVRREPFLYKGREFVNVVGTLEGADPGAPRVLVGAHVDTVRGTPGADDNASGVAGLLECARLLQGCRPRATIELVGFNLEERQGWTYRVGSRRWAAQARRRGVRYAGALVLEMIGFRSTAPDSQVVPAPIRWMKLPRTGHFLAAVGDTRSRRLLRAFLDAAEAAAPELPVVSLHSPLRGWLVWATRRSDNASFWSARYPALMLTDTANLRNPHYHRSTDRSSTLDFGFAARVTDAVAECVRRLACS